MRFENTIELGSVSIIKGGKRLPKGVSLIQVPNKHPYIRVCDIPKTKTIQLNSNFEYVDNETQKEISRYIVSSGDIILSIVGSIGFVAVVGESLHGANLTENCVKITEFNNVDKDFLYYYLISNYGQEEIAKGTVGAVQAKLPIKNIQKIKIPKVSMKIQQKIASILSALDDKIELNQRINDNLEQQAQTLFANRFLSYTRSNLPNGWRVMQLGDVAVICNKSFNPLKEPETLLEHYSIPAFDEAKFPVFELSTNIKSNKFLVDTDCFMISKLNPTTKRVWKPYCISNQAVCSTEFIVYRAKERFLTDFLYSLIDSETFSDFMCSHVTGSTGSRQRTTPSDTLQFEFVLPTTEEIQAFSMIAAPMYQQIRLNAIANDKLRRLRDSLLPRLMSGEIDVSAI